MSGKKGFLGGLFSKFADKINDDTLDPHFQRKQDEAKEKWRKWTVEKGYTVNDELPDFIKEAVGGSPFLKSDRFDTSFIVSRKIIDKEVTSFFFKRYVGSFIKGDTDSYDAIVGYLRLDLGSGKFAVDNETLSPYKIGDRSWKIENEKRTDKFTLSGDPEGFSNELLDYGLKDWVGSLREVKVSYSNGDLLFIRPCPEFFARLAPFGAEDNTVYDLGPHRRWDLNLETWIKKLIMITGRNWNIGTGSDI